ncbi:histidine-type phosphatase [Pinirhizobacter soli]|uniref:histidine-type phosphatase n=1 Tax=Pinirhizobacter soli TaxID=2786953 RepID=UPI00202A5331
MIAAVGGADTVAAPASRGETPVAEIVLLRHGVRSPTSAPDAHASYASQPWPSWPVAPGILTPHGHAGMQALGAFYRQRLIASGNLGKACPTADQLQVIADTTPRNKESAQAVIDGLVPGCHVSFLAMPGDDNNPLFHYVKGDKDDDAASPSPTEISPALAELQAILLGCNDKACLKAASASGKTLLVEDDKPTPKAGKLSGTFSENLMLAYAEGKPANEVAWGRADAALLGKVIVLHNDAFARDKKSMPAATQAGSNLAAHILATLQTAAGESTTTAAFSSQGRGTFVLIGHDTNLANIAGVFGLDWHDTNRPDDYPPGGGLVFDLFKRGNQYVVKVSALMPSMDDLRSNHFDDVKPAKLHVGGCGGHDACPLATFAAAATKSIDSSRVMPSLPAMTPQSQGSP